MVNETVLVKRELEKLRLKLQEGTEQSLMKKSLVQHVAEGMSHRV